MEKRKKLYETPVLRVTQLVQCCTILTGSATIDALSTEHDYDNYDD